MTGKVPLVNERLAEFGRERLIPVTSMLPFFQREGAGYVHRIRSALMHLSGSGDHTHTSVHFWCGQGGFLYPEGSWNRKHARATVLLEPSPERVVCATCEARAIGAGQLGPHKIGGRTVRFSPHRPLFASRPIASVVEEA